MNVPMKAGHKNIFEHVFIELRFHSFWTHFGRTATEQEKFQTRYCQNFMFNFDKSCKKVGQIIASKKLGRTPKFREKSQKREEDIQKLSGRTWCCQLFVEF